MFNWKRQADIFTIWFYEDYYRYTEFFVYVILSILIGDKFF